MSRDRPEIEHELRRFILEELIEQPYDGRDPLADAAVDSLGHEQLVEFVDEAFGVQISDSEMIQENFETLPALVALIEAKRHG